MKISDGIKRLLLIQAQVEMSSVTLEAIKYKIIKNKRCIEQYEKCYPVKSKNII